MRADPDVGRDGNGGAAAIGTAIGVINAIVGGRNNDGNRNNGGLRNNGGFRDGNRAGFRGGNRGPRTGSNPAIGTAPPAPSAPPPIVKNAIGSTNKGGLSGWGSQIKKKN